MKRVFCPKCDHQIVFDESRHEEGEAVAFVCPQCAARFKIKIGKKAARPKPGTGREAKERRFSCGFISVIENAFGYKQELPLALGDNVVGRRNKGTDGVDVPIITSDPSMGRKHCVIHVKQDARGKFSYALRDFPSLTGTFLRNELLGDRDVVPIAEGDVVTIGATTFILHTPGGETSED